MLKLFRRGTSRSLVAVLLIASVTTLCVYYANNGGPIEKVGDGRNGGGGGGGGMGGGGGDASAAGGDYGDREEGIPEEWGPAQETKPGWLESDSSSDPTICPRVPEAVADIDTVKQFANFEFQVSFILPFFCLTFKFKAHFSIMSRFLYGGTYPHRSFIPARVSFENLLHLELMKRLCRSTWFK